jgi:hypothetical protein
MAGFKIAVCARTRAEAIRIVAAMIEASQRPDVGSKGCGVPIFGWREPRRLDRIEERLDCIFPKPTAPSQAGENDFEAGPAVPMQSDPAAARADDDCRIRLTIRYEKAAIAEALSAFRVGRWRGALLRDPWRSLLRGIPVDLDLGCFGFDKELLGALDRPQWTSFADADLTGIILATSFIGTGQVSARAERLGAPDPDLAGRIERIRRWLDKRKMQAGIWPRWWGGTVPGLVVGFDQALVPASFPSNPVDLPDFVEQAGQIKEGGDLEAIALTPMEMIDQPQYLARVLADWLGRAGLGNGATGTRGVPPVEPYDINGIDDEAREIASIVNATRGEEQPGRPGRVRIGVVSTFELQYATGRAEAENDQTQPVLSELLQYWRPYRVNALLLRALLPPALARRERAVKPNTAIPLPAQDTVAWPVLGEAR